MKAFSLAVLFAPLLVLAAPSFQSGHAGVGHHHAGLNGGDLRMVSPYAAHAKRGPAKARHCKARASSISIASVSSTSVHAKQTHTTTTTTKKPKPTQKDDDKDDDKDDGKGSSGSGDFHTGDATVYGAGTVRKNSFSSEPFPIRSDPNSLSSP